MPNDKQILTPSSKILVPKSRQVQNIVNDAARQEQFRKQQEMERDMLVMMSLGTLAESIHKHASNTDPHDLQVRMRELVKGLTEDVTQADELLQLVLCYCWEKQHNVAAGVIRRHRETVQKHKEKAEEDSKNEVT